ncbi:MAG: STAS domain-containing protein [Chloroflexota bacterium]|nr:MAG: STAS domain-containing protein [Chloroflexota bacterium]
MPASILKDHSYLIATLQGDLSDAEWVLLRDNLLDKVGQFRSHGVVIDVAGLDIMDSFATRTLHGIAQACRLRGADSVVVGIRPEIAFTMVQMGWTGRLTNVRTALDLEDGLALLDRITKSRKP